MKSIFKIAPFIVAIIGVVSCTNDKEPIATANGFQLQKVDNIVFQPVLLEINAADTIAKLNWTRSDYGMSTQSDYFIVVSDRDADPNFLAAVETKVGVFTAVDARKGALRVDEFNTMINALPSFNCNTMNIDVRIKSKLGVSSNAPIQYSNPITFSVKGYSRSKPKLAFATSAANATGGVNLTSSSYQTLEDFEGYFFLEAGNYKFFKPDSCGDFSNATVYGLSGTTTGNLVLDGNTGFNVASAGHYYIKANLSETGSGALSYSVSAFNTGTNGFGIYGKATRAFGFANTTPMTYNPTTKKWSVTIELIDGQKFSFKTSSTGPAATLVGSGTAAFSESPITTFSGTGVPASEGTIKAPGDFVSNDTKTRYNVEVDLSRTRDYTYKITAAPN